MSDPKDRFAQELAGGELEALTDAWSEALSARPVEAPSPGRRAALLGATRRCSALIGRPPRSAAGTASRVESLLIGNIIKN